MAVTFRAPVQLFGFCRGFPVAHPIPHSTGTTALSREYSFTCPQRVHLISNKTATPTASFLLQLKHRYSVFFSFVLLIRSPYNDLAASGAGSLVDPYSDYGETGALITRNS